MVMVTVFAVKNRAPHDEKPFFFYEKPELAAIPKECVLLLTKQYYTRTPLSNSPIRLFSYCESG